MERVPDQAEIAWLESDGPLFAGAEMGGFQARAIIRHAIYEQPGGSTGAPTHHESRVRLLSEGLAQPVMIGGVNLDEGTTDTGGPLGWAARPQAWSRITWDGLVARHGMAIPAATQTATVGLFGSIFPTGSWPVTLQPPPEGSVDHESFLALCEALADHSSASALCYFYYCFLAVADF